MTLRSATRQILGTFVSIFAGWLAAVFYMAIVTTILFFGNPQQGPLGALILWAVFMSVWIIPIWLLVLIPLYLFLPTSSFLWQKSVCTACGIIAGIAIAWPFFHPTWGVESTYSYYETWNFFVVAAIIGGVTCFVGAATRHRFKLAN